MSPACTASAQRLDQVTDLLLVVGHDPYNPATGRKSSVAADRSAARRREVGGQERDHLGDPCAVAGRQVEHVEAAAGTGRRRRSRCRRRAARSPRPGNRQRCSSGPSTRNARIASRPLVPRGTAASSSARRRSSIADDGVDVAGLPRGRVPPGHVAHRLVAERRRYRSAGSPRQARDRPTLRRARCSALLTAARSCRAGPPTSRGGEAQDLAQQQHRPLLARGAAARRRTPARRSPGPRTSAGRAHGPSERVRVRLEPGRLGSAAAPGRGRWQLAAAARRSISVRQRLVAIRYSHGRTEPRGPRTVRSPARPARASPAPRPRRRRPTRACGSSGRATRRGTVRPAPRSVPDPRLGRYGPPRSPSPG